jgi:hypothetical protein
MFGPLGQIVMLIGLTSGLRALGRLVGPRRSGLLMGLPSTTALVLLGCGLEHGLDEATVAAEACLAGLVAAAMLPVAFARALEAGWRLSRAVVAAVGSYLTVALSLWWLPGLGPVGCVVAASLGVLVACRVAGRAAHEDHAERPSSRRSIGGCVRLLVTRGAVPAVYITVIRTLRWLAGAGSSGRFITFPGGSLALLIATHVEAGPATAGRLATAMPSGSVATLAFLAAFRFVGPRVGLGWGILFGYVAAVGTLTVVESIVSWDRGHAAHTTSWIGVSRGLGGRPSWLRADPAVWRWFAPKRRPILRRRFAPGLECLAG